MVDVPHEFGLRPLGSGMLTKAAGLGRYDHATRGVHRLRNRGKRNDCAQGDPGNHNFTSDHDYPPVLQRTPLPGTMQSFRQIAQQIPFRVKAPHQLHDFVS
ncbi:MAG TPA: hypothetical protein VLE24_07385 [Methyloceanibacter sp.]|nr:hypothetical protein [Methyloceanibacter sp.]